VAAGSPQPFGRVSRLKVLGERKEMKQRGHFATDAMKGVVEKRCMREQPKKQSVVTLMTYICHDFANAMLGPLYTRSQGQCSTQIKHSY